MHNIKNFYRNRKILVTGVTGFKGSWLASWLLILGAKVYGIGFNPNKNKNLFYKLQLDKKISLKLLDVRNFKSLNNYTKFIKPEIIFHLAAQPIIFESYKRPRDTFDINFIGTINILEIFRINKNIKSLICVTSDKCYENKGLLKGYKENDTLGGVDPYSASKASAELAVRAYRESFFKNYDLRGISTVRAGNVIGGGDWSPKRLIPDAIRSLLRKKSILIRNPKYNRPWQFVLEPLKGYLLLAEKQFYNPKFYSGAWNFGTKKNSITDVKKIISYIIKFWGSGKLRVQKTNKFYEQENLQLDIQKSKKYLSWLPTYNVATSVKVTTEWYYDVYKLRKTPLEVTNFQINKYMNENNWT
jgi:CDP-glucose 4,6-dehydratase